VLVDVGDIATTSFIRDFRRAHPSVLLFLVSTATARAHLRLALLARLGVDDVFFALPGEDERLQEALEPRAVAVGLLEGAAAEVAALPGVFHSESRHIGAILGVLARDPCPPWTLSELYRRCGVHERTAERRVVTGGHGLRLRDVHRHAVVQRAHQLKRRGLTWEDVAALLRAPTTGALLKRVARGNR
jgi:hypothetical protein